MVDQNWPKYHKPRSSEWHLESFVIWRTTTYPNLIPQRKRAILCYCKQYATLETFFFTCVSNLAEIRYFRNFPACSINIFKSIMMCLTDADFKFNWSIDIRHHRSFVEASKQLVLASAEIWLKKTKRVSTYSTKSDSESGFKILF